MSNGGLYITKRDGKLEAFSLEKIKVAISKAFLASGFYATDEDLNGILSRVRVTNGITVEEIHTSCTARSTLKIVKSARKSTS